MKELYEKLSAHLVKEEAGLLATVLNNAGVTEFNVENDEVTFPRSSIADLLQFRMQLSSLSLLAKSKKTYPMTIDPNLNLLKINITAVKDPSTQPYRNFLVSNHGHQNLSKNMHACKTDPWLMKFNVSFLVKFPEQLASNLVNYKEGYLQVSINNNEFHHITERAPLELDYNTAKSMKLIYIALESYGNDSHNQQCYCPHSLEVDLPFNWVESISPDKEKEFVFIVNITENLICNATIKSLTAMDEPTITNKTI